MFLLDSPHKLQNIHQKLRK